MRICQGCGGVLGRDCFNEPECVWIGNQQDNEAYQQASFVPQLESQINDMEVQFHLASNQIEVLIAENNKLRQLLNRLRHENMCSHTADGLIYDALKGGES